MMILEHHKVTRMSAMRELNQLITEIDDFTDTINHCPNPTGPDAINACFLFRNYLNGQLSDIIETQPLTAETASLMKNIIDTPNKQWTDWLQQLKARAENINQHNTRTESII